MRCWIRIMMMLLFVMLLSSAMTQEHNHSDEDEVDCESDKLNTIELGYCAGLAYEKADKELNEVYKKLVASYKHYLKEEQEKGEEDFDYIQKPLEYLRQAQRDWIKFRDSSCEYEASYFWGGTAKGLVYRNCLTSMTIERTKKLREGWE